MPAIESNVKSEVDLEDESSTQLHTYVRTRVRETTLLITNMWLCRYTYSRTQYLSAVIKEITTPDFLHNVLLNVTLSALPRRDRQEKLMLH